MTYLQNYNERGYLDLLQHVLDHGTDKSDRTGVGTRSIFGAQLKFRLWDGFPLLTTKKLFTKAIFSELGWLISGSTNVWPMAREGVTIWNEWADPENGELGPVYGKQWRSWEAPDGRTIDQLQNALDMIKEQPDSRRIIVSAWNPADIGEMALPPCHAFFQFEVHDEKLSCHLYQRSADIFLGVPFNIASYAALTHVMAQLAGLDAYELTMSFGDIHIYNNHFDQVKEQLSREPREMPQLILSKDIRGLNVITDDFRVEGYDPHPPIKAEVAI